MSPDISHNVQNIEAEQETTVGMESNCETVKNGYRDKNIEAVVIAGMSARLQDWNNLQEFADSLLNGRHSCYPIGSSRFLSPRSGKSHGHEGDDDDSFDWDFFNISPTEEDERVQAEVGVLLELTFEAIIDAGISPMSVRNSSTGVFIGVDPYIDPSSKVRSKELTKGTSLARRISQAFQFQGPIFTTELTNLFPLVKATRAIQMGLCDGAIVGGVQLSTNPAQHNSGDTVVLYISRGDHHHVRRCYGNIVNAKFRRGVHLAAPLNFLKQIYREAGLGPEQVSCIEMTDSNETVLEFFSSARSNKKSPLLWRISPTEECALSGLSQFAKTVLAIHKGIIPAGPKTEMSNVANEDKFQLVTRHTGWVRGLVALDRQSSSAHAHIILEPSSNSHRQSNLFSSGNSRLPIIVPFAGRTKENVEYALGRVSRNNQEEAAALLQEIALAPIDGYNVRGYSVINGSQVDIEVEQGIKKYRPVWFIYTGMGSQWDGMGRDLIKLKVFKQSIDRCAKALKTVGVDLYEAILGSSKGIQQGESLMRSMVSIAAFHVALTDVLRSVGIEPDGMLGHSSGEVGCAYGDGCLTPEETVLLTHARVKALLEMGYAPGTMAIMGLGLDDALTRIPPDVDIACHNTKDNVTVAGPRDSIRSFVNKLTAQGIYAVLVETNGMAFHSRYIKSSEQRMLELCERAAPKARPRTQRWKSTSIPESEWDSWTEHSAAYQVNNLMVPVYFQEAVAHIPEEAIVIEIAPHSLLQSLIKKSVPSSCVHVGLLDKTAPDELEYLFKSIGKLYNAGLNPCIGKLYDGIEYPVSNQAASLASLIRWNYGNGTS